jgi:hypothetical protein
MKVAVLTSQWEMRNLREPSGIGIWHFRFFVHDTPESYFTCRNMGFQRARVLAVREAIKRRAPTVTLIT